MKTNLTLQLTIYNIHFVSNSFQNTEFYDTSYLFHVQQHTNVKCIKIRSLDFTIQYINLEPR